MKPVKVFRTVIFLRYGIYVSEQQGMN